MMSKKRIFCGFNDSLAKSSELIFKTLGLVFLHGPNAENLKLAAFAIDSSYELGCLPEEEYNEVKKEWELENLSRIYGSLFCLGTSSLSLYESVWRTGLAMQQSRDEVRSLMHKAELIPNNPSNEPEDHLGYIYFLIGSTLEKLAAKGASEKQKEQTLIILQDGLSHLSWTEKLSSAISSRNIGTFYSTLINIANRLSKTLLKNN